MNTHHTPTYAHVDVDLGPSDPLAALNAAAVAQAALRAEALHAHTFLLTGSPLDGYRLRMSFELPDPHPSKWVLLAAFARANLTVSSVQYRRRP